MRLTHTAAGLAGLRVLGGGGASPPITLTTTQGRELHPPCCPGGETEAQGSKESGQEVGGLGAHTFSLGQKGQVASQAPKPVPVLQPTPPPRVAAALLQKT